MTTINDNNTIIPNAQWWSLYYENYHSNLFLNRHINNEFKTKSFDRCLGCNVKCNIMIKCESHSDRTCVICLESNNVCYGCKKCIDKNLPSCCIECFNNILIVKN